MLQVLLHAMQLLGACTPSNFATMANIFTEFVKLLAACASCAPKHTDSVKLLGACARCAFKQLHMLCERILPQHVHTNIFTQVSLGVCL